MERLSVDPSFAERSVNEGFSGGEKKRHEILQLELLQPKIAVLDETDSGLDIDALKVVSEGVNRVQAGGETGVLLITHYTRILRYIQPDFVHVFVGGRIVEEGGPELADTLEAEGYEKFLPKAGAQRMTPGDRPPALDVEKVRKDFPALERLVHGDKPLVYLDNAATSQKPRQVLDALDDYYTRHNANVHRGIHVLAEEATALYEGARDKVAALRQRGRPGRGRLHQELHRGAQPGRQRHRLGRPRLARRASARATRSSSPRWSTTPTSCRGSWSPRAPARRCAGSA